MADDDKPAGQLGDQSRQADDSASEEQRDDDNVQRGRRDPRRPAMFDIGFTELLVIAVVALLVLGPERLPKAARFAGLWVRRGRAQWASVRSELERELAADELKRSLRETEDAMRDIDRSEEHTSELQSLMRISYAVFS